MQTRLGGEQIGSETMTVQNVTAGRRRGRNSSQREKKKKTEKNRWKYRNRNADSGNKHTSHSWDHFQHPWDLWSEPICDSSIAKKKEKKKRERKRLLQANTTHQSVKGTARLKKSDSDSFLRLSVLFSSPQIRVLSSTDSTFNLYRHEILFIYLLIFYHHCWFCCHFLYERPLLFFFVQMFLFFHM